MNNIPPIGLVSTSDAHDLVLRSHKASLLDQAYQAYCDRVAAGENIDPDEYCAQHPHMMSSLGKLLQCHSFAEETFRLAEAEEYPAPGESFLHFSLMHELGTGAFAKVFLARDTKLRRHVAVKLSRRTTDEAEILGSIDHPNIVSVHSIDKDLDTGLSAICMPYRGCATLEDILDKVQSQKKVPERARTILEVLQEMPVPPTNQPSTDAIDPILSDGAYVDGIRAIGLHIVSALSYLHARGICHRDLKPSNVLLTQTGTPFVLDFNLSTDAHSQLIPFGGTLPYMAPEILASVSAPQDISKTIEAGVRADLYSFGVILYQLLTGVHPYGPLPLKLKTPELRALLMERQSIGAKPVRDLNPHVDRKLSDLIQQCLAHDPARRPASALAVAASLTPKAPPRRRNVLLAGVLLAAILVIGLFVASSLLTPGIEQRIQNSQSSYQQGRYQEAIKQSSEVLLTDPNSLPALAIRARAYQKLAAAQERSADALPYYNSAGADFRAASKHSPDGRYFAGLGYCLTATGDYTAADAAFQEAIKADYKNAEVYNNLGFLELKRHDFAPAAEHLSEAIKLKPELSTAYYNRALIALAQESAKADPKAKPAGAVRSLDDTIRDIEKAAELGETSGWFYFDAGQIYALAKNDDLKREKAVHYLKLAVEGGVPRKDVLSAPLTKAILTDVDRAMLNAIVPKTKKAEAPQRFIDPIHD